jgi:hypothetical protein
MPLRLDLMMSREGRPGSIVVRPEWEPVATWNEQQVTVGEGQRSPPDWDTAVDILRRQLRSYGRPAHVISVGGFSSIHPSANARLDTVVTELVGRWLAGDLEYLFRDLKLK